MSFVAEGHDNKIVIRHVGTDDLRGIEHLLHLYVNFMYTSGEKERLARLKTKKGTQLFGVIYDNLDSTGENDQRKLYILEVQPEEGRLLLFVAPLKSKKGKWIFAGREKQVRYIGSIETPSKKFRDHVINYLDEIRQQFGKQEVRGQQVAIRGLDAAQLTPGLVTTSPEQ